ncbi:uncharacterized protein LOC115446778 [Manduca sexta]|uniref:uncharacterized protein LOC115446778 n=1 Tax=Manduca sexta TaxID=7130 RepID=UPI00189025C0|nr:uncharacterized protein LOC115446778 [Manduca sexta]
MDNLLIEAVHRRDPLWNSSNEHHKNSNILKKLWEEVAEEVQGDVKTLKTRWRNLRAYYIKECQKIEKSRGNSSSSWQYFDKLRFITNNMPISNILKYNCEESYMSMSQNYCNPVEFLESPSPVPSSLSDSGTSPARKNKSVNKTNLNANDTIADLKRRKIEILEKEAIRRSNDDLLFFESLLPYLSEIPRIRKLQLRSKIHELIVNELVELEGRDTCQTDT